MTRSASRPPTDDAATRTGDRRDLVVRRRRPGRRILRFAGMVIVVVLLAVALAVAAVVGLAALTDRPEAALSGGAVVELAAPAAGFLLVSGRSRRRSPVALPAAAVLVALSDVAVLLPLRDATSLVYLRGGGHNLYQDRPEESMRTIRAFLTGRPGPIAPVGGTMPDDYQGPA